MPKQQIIITVKSVASVSKYELNYGQTIADLLQLIGDKMQPKHILVNMHGKKLPLDMPLRGCTTFIHQSIQ
jgi:hypothetical protein